MVAAFGRDVGNNAYADPVVATLLEKVRSRIAMYLDIKHPPLVNVAGMEEMLKKIESDWNLFHDNTLRLNDGSMTQAEYDKYFVSFMTAGPDPHHVSSSSVAVTSTPLQTAPPIPTNSGGSVPPSSSAPRTSPTVVANPPDVTACLVPNPVRQDAVASNSSRLVCTVYFTVFLIHQFPSRNLHLQVALVTNVRGLLS